MQWESATPLEAVLFDATGTLIDVVEPVGETYSRAARRQGIDLPAPRLDDAFRRIVKQAAPIVMEANEPLSERVAREREWWRGIVRETFLATDDFVEFREPDALFEDLFEHFAKAGAWQLRAGSLESLRALRAHGLRTGVVSNFDHRLPQILQLIGLSAFFDCIVVPSMCGVRKPDRGIFEAALKSLHSRPSETAYVGHDPILDLDAARAAGLIPVDTGDFADLAELTSALVSAATFPAQSPEAEEKPAR